MLKNHRTYKTAGILGGLGPAATVDLLKKIIELTPAKNDQEHIPLISYSNSQIPDRTEHIINNGASPLPELIKTAVALEKSGADFIAIPCNTAHKFFRTVQETVHIPVINMIEETANYVKEVCSNLTKVGLLITTGSLFSGIYPHYLNQKGIETLAPSPETQEKVMKAIYLIKAKKRKLPRAVLEQACKEMIEDGAEAIIMGCTEVPLVMKQENISVPLINPTKILARKIINKSLEV